MQEGDLFVESWDLGGSSSTPPTPWVPPPSGLQGARGQAPAHVGEVQASEAPPHCFLQSKARGGCWGRLLRP